MRDIRDMVAYRDDDGIARIFVNMRSIHDLDIYLVGSKNTVYAGGFFQFRVNLKDYPHHPPKFVHICPVRIHPNLYQNGKVCLTILGTWHDSRGCSWTPMMSMLAVMIEIMMLFDNNPIAHEPGCANRDGTGYARAARYQCLTHQVINRLNDTGLSKELRQWMLNVYARNRDMYLQSEEQLVVGSTTYFHAIGPVNVVRLADKLKLIDQMVLHELAVLKPVAIRLTSHGLRMLFRYAYRKHRVPNYTTYSDELAAACASTDAKANDEAETTEAVEAVEAQKTSPNSPDTIDITAEPHTSASKAVDSAANSVASASTTSTTMEAEARRAMDKFKKKKKPSSE